MTRAVGLSFAAFIGVAVTAPAAQRQNAFTLDDLTVSSEFLTPLGCSLSPSASVRIDERTRSGLWAGLPISSNPWTGTETIIIAAIRDRVLGSPRLPDGPPPSRRELTRMRLQLANDIEQAYAAIYTDKGPNLVTVHAVQFKEATALKRESRRPKQRGRFEIDRSLVVVAGEGSCFEAVLRHVSELTR
jgi:hypothetical protein